MFLRLEVHLGEHDRRTDCDPQCSPSLQIIGVRKILRPKIFDSQMYHNDISLLQLATPAVFVAGSYIKVPTATTFSVLH
jgi:hypothetical protein